MKIALITRRDVETVASELNIKLDSERKKILRSLSGIDVQACPGSGKTTIVAAKLALLSKKWPWKHRGVCVLSHTNVAKDEISNRLRKIYTGYRMLSYPHFIGTIQEFVNSFLGLPYLRSKYEAFEFQYMDSEPLYFPNNKAKHKSDPKEYKLSYQIHKRRVEKSDFSFCKYSDDLNECLFTEEFISFCKNIEYLINNSKNKRIDVLSYLSFKKNNQIKQGLLTYREMYAFADALIEWQLSCKDVLKYRFPFVIIDEMQDTEKYQDELLQKVFPLNSPEKCIVQRFGDPDQAIYDGMNDLPNESYNTESPAQKLCHITNSFRLPNSIGSKIKGLSINKVDDLRAEKSLVEDGLEHAIFLYRKGEEKKVIPYFKDYIRKQLSDSDRIKKRLKEKIYSEEKITVKIIGAIKAVKRGDLGVKTYFEEFKELKKDKKCVPKFFCEAIKYVQANKKGNSDSNYKILVDSILILLDKLRRKYKNKKYNKTTLVNELKEEEKYRKFQEYLVKCLFCKEIKAECDWRGFIEPMKTLLDLSEEDMNHDFLKYDAGVYQTVSKGNEEEEIIEIDGKRIILDIEYNTIHGVKGETHDVTMVLETQFHKKDISSIIDWILYPKKTESPTGIRKPKFMRQLYVACSRPMHLLCLAVDKDSISEDNKKTLDNLGWRIIVLN